MSSSEDLEKQFFVIIEQKDGGETKDCIKALCFGLKGAGKHCEENDVSLDRSEWRLFILLFYSLRLVFICFAVFRIMRSEEKGSNPIVLCVQISHSDV